MAFSRRGTSEPVIEVIDGYDKKNEQAILCPECKKPLNLKSSSGIIRQGSKLIIGQIIIKCSSCGKQVRV